MMRSDRCVNNSPNCFLIKAVSSGRGASEVAGPGKVVHPVDERRNETLVEFRKVNLRQIDRIPSVTSGSNHWS